MRCCRTVSVFSSAQAASTMAKREWSSSTVSGCSRPLPAGGAADLDPVPLEDRRDRGGRRNRLVAEILEPPGKLAPAPGRMLRSQRQHRLLHRRTTARRRGKRPPRPLPKPRRALPPPALQPFVAGHRAHPEPPAKAAEIDPLQIRKHHKLPALVHPRNLAKRHPTASLIRCRKCPRCLRTPVHHVSGLNTQGGRWRASSSPRCRPALASLIGRHWSSTSGSFLAVVYLSRVQASLRDRRFWPSHDGVRR